LDKEVRQVHWDAHSIIPLLDQHFKLQKFYGTYIKEMANVDSEGLYHPWFDLTGTVTGRLSSNLQQLPRGDKTADVKKLIVSRFTGGSLLNADISQGELRMFCITSKDRELTRVYRNGEDAHTQAAMRTFGVPESKVTKVMRERIKAMVSFGLIYGRAAEALAADMNWSVHRAQDFIDDYFALYSGVRAQIEVYKDFAVEHGYAINLFGRKRRLPEIHERNQALRHRAERQAVNFPIQSLLHDYMLKAQVEIRHVMRDAALLSLLCGETHDSIIVDMYPGEEETVCYIVREILENLPFEWITITIVADLAVGPNLYDVRTVERAA